MSEKPVSIEEKPSLGKLVLPSLALSRFATETQAILTSLLLIDIGFTFGCSVGVAGQFSTASSVVGVVFSLLMGVLSLGFKHKSLLMIGLLVKSIAALGCGFAPNFDTMLVFYTLSGVGGSMVAPMTMTLVGEHFSQERRSAAIGWIAASAAFAYVLGAPVIGFVASFGGWRLAFLGFVLPIPLLGLLLTAAGVPSLSHSIRAKMRTQDYLEGFKKIFSNLSADSCLLASAFSSASWVALVVYASSFFRQRFLAPIGSVAVILLVAASCYTLGALISGRIAKKTGRKPLAVSTVLFTGVFAITYTLFPNIWLSIALAFIGSLFSGMRYTACNSLILEQDPGFSGTMMSLSSAAESLGTALGAGIGGATLLLFNYEGMGMSLGVMGIAAAILLQLLATDPTGTETRVHS